MSTSPRGSLKAPSSGEELWVSEIQTKRVLRVVGGSWEAEDDVDDGGGSEGGGGVSMMV